MSYTMRRAKILMTAAAFLLLGGTAGADSLVEFVNGHVMRVQEYNVDGDYLQLILGDDSEITVLRSKVLHIEEAEISREELAKGASGATSGQSRGGSSNRSAGNSSSRSSQAGGTQRSSSSRSYQPPQTGGESSSGNRNTSPNQPPNQPPNDGRSGGSDPGRRNVWDTGGSNEQQSSGGNNQKSGQGSKSRGGSSRGGSRGAFGASGNR